MTTQQLTFQYWRDGRGTWQWQLSFHERLSPTTHNNCSCLKGHRMIAAGIPCETEEEVLDAINRVKKSFAASIIKASPVLLTTNGAL